MALTKEDLQAIGNLIDQSEARITSEINQRFDTVHEDLDIIKEEAAITRNAVNLLLRWAEKADATTVNVGLYDRGD